MHLLRGFLHYDLRFHGCFQSITPEWLASLFTPEQWGAAHVHIPSTTNDLGSESCGVQYSHSGKSVPHRTLNCFILLTPSVSCASTNLYSISRVVPYAQLSDLVNWSPVQSVTNTFLKSGWIMSTISSLSIQQCLDMTLIHLSYVIFFSSNQAAVLLLNHIPKWIVICLINVSIILLTTTVSLTSLYFVGSSQCLFLTATEDTQQWSAFQVNIKCSLKEEEKIKT